jgi:hypothetical protein
MASAKFCIFCGKPPTDKNKEHVVPRWLIALTGDPKRQVNLGLMFQPDNPGEPLKHRTYAFDQFTFPACEACNSEHAALENAAKVVVEKLLSRKAVVPQEISALFDWFDKVRVGLWLGFHQLTKNQLDIEPNFHISRRIGQFDRMLIVERYAPAEQRLNFSGPDTPAFGFTPSAFSLLINDLTFTNISFQFLFARRLGFPYPSSAKLAPDGVGMIYDMQPGRGRVMLPLLQRTVRGRGIVLYQPMFRQGLSDGQLSYYDDPYVRAHSLDYEHGIGSVYMQQGTKTLRELAPNEEVHVDPPAVGSLWTTMLKMAPDVLDWQDWLLEGQYSLEDLSPDHRRLVQERQRVAKRMNAALRTVHLSTFQRAALSALKGHRQAGAHPGAPEKPPRPRPPDRSAR